MARHVAFERDDSVRDDEDDDIRFSSEQELDLQSEKCVLCDDKVWYSNLLYVTIKFGIKACCM